MVANISAIIRFRKFIFGGGLKIRSTGVPDYKSGTAESGTTGNPVLLCIKDRFTYYDRLRL